MFNRRASDPKSRPDRILDALSLRPGQNVADIGAGGGYFSLRFAEVVGRKGQVYATDTNSEFLEFVRESANKGWLSNIRTILITESGLELPEKSLDLVFIRNVYHHLQNRVEYFRKLRALLKPGGRVAIIEYKRGGLFSFRRIFGHHVPREIIAEEMKEAGYRLKENFDFLPEQSFTIFIL